jgi:hypothetical protein
MVGPSHRRALSVLRYLGRGLYYLGISGLPLSPVGFLWAEHRPDGSVATPCAPDQIRLSRWERRQWSTLAASLSASAADPVEPKGNRQNRG